MDYAILSSQFGVDAVVLGRRKRQRSLFGATTLLPASDLDRMGLFGKLARVGEEIFSDEDFVCAYCLDNGRPSAPPSLVALATLLQFREGLSDREVINRLRYDLRWKAALHLDALSTDAPFSRTTLQAFRSRLTLYEMEGLAFERSLKVAQEAGLLPRRLRLAADSTPVRGHGAVKDTYNLLSDAITAVLRRVARSVGSDAASVAASSGLDRHVSSPSVKGSEEIDWGNDASVSGFLERLLADCRTALRLAETHDLGNGNEAQLLRRIVAQDVDEGGPGEPSSIRRGVAKERIVSATDPEMRTRRSSQSNKYSGHKAHAVAEIETGIVTAVAVTSPNESEGDQLEALIEQTRRQVDGEVDEILGDCAYGTRKAVETAESAGVKLRARMPRGSRKQFQARDFNVSEDLQRAHCPAGHRSDKVYRKGQRGWSHQWSPGHCQACALKERCTPSTRRTLTVPPDFHDRRRREREAWSSEGRQALRERIIVEHAFARLKARGAGRSRYFGRAKTRFQWLWTAAAANLSLTWNRVPVAA